MNPTIRPLATFVCLIAIAGATIAAAPRRARPAARPKPSPAARTWTRSLNLHDKVAQLVVLPIYGDAPNSQSDEYRKILGWVDKLHIGGLVLVNRIVDGSTRYSEPYALATFLNRMQRAAKVPLLVAGDFERGDSMRVQSAVKFPHAMAFAATRDPAFSRYEGEVTARQARALGVPWILAPDADVNNNPDNPIINIRSYSEDPEEVAAHVRAFIEGAHSVVNEPVLVTVKHFPGHGDTATDSHLALAVNNAPKDRIESVELVPFRAGIAAGADSVMTAHIAVPALEEPSLPSTLSHRILTGLLREELGFHGLISTDALDMYGISKQWTAGQAAVKALQAGADVLLMPANPEQAIDTVVAALKRGELSRARLDESVARMLAAKARVGLDRRRFVNVEAAEDVLDAPDEIRKVQEIADRAVTLVRNTNSVVPLERSASVCFLVMTEGRASVQGRAFAGEVRRKIPNAQVLRLDPDDSAADQDQAVATAKAADGVVAVAFASVASYRGSVALAGGYPKMLSALIEGGKPVVLVAMGNPYLLRSFPNVAAYMATYSTVAPCEIAAAKALFGEIPIRGRLPVTIPGLAAYGDGLQMAAGL